MQIEKLIAELVLRYRWAVIIASALLVAWAASGIGKLYFSNSYHMWFEADNPDLVEFEDLEATYSKNDNVLIILAPENGDMFTAGNLTAVMDLTDAAWQTPYVTRVDSLTNFQHTVASGDDLLVGDLVTDPGALTAEQLLAVKHIAINEPNLVNRLVSTTGHVAGVNITVQLPGVDEGLETPQVAGFARQLAAELEQSHPGLETYLTGIIMMNNSLSESTRNDLATLIPLSFVLMFVLLALLVGRISGTFATLLLTVGSILTAVGLWGHLGMPMSTPTSVAANIILTVSIANCVHILYTFRYGLSEGLEKQAALRESLRVNAEPVALASLTTAVGFLSLNLSDAPPFQHLGNVVTFGVLTSLLLSLTFLPALLSVLPVKASAVSDRSHHMERLGEFVVARRRPLLWGMTALIVLVMLGIPRNQIDDVFVNYFDETIPFRIDSDFATANMSGAVMFDYSLRSRQPGGVSEPVFLHDVSAFADWLQQQPEVIHVNSVTDIMRRLNKSMHGDDPQHYTLPQNRELAAQYLLLYELSLPYGLDLNNQIDIDKSATRLTVTLETISSQQQMDLDRRARQWIAANTTSIDPSNATGPAIMMAKLGQKNAVSMITGLLIAIVMISLVLIIAFRSFKYGLLSLIPNIAPIFMAFGIWGFINGLIGLSLAAVASISLGIVIDDTVHFFSKYLRALRERGLSSEAAVRYAFRTVGQALVTTSIVLVAGFLVISRSHFYLNSGMGLLTAMVIALALFSVMFLLPPLLMLFNPGESETKSPQGVPPVEQSA